MRNIVRNDLINLGEIIRKRRKMLGLLQSDLHEYTGVSIRTIQLIEMGKANPSLETLIKIADPIGLTVNLSIKQVG